MSVRVRKTLALTVVELLVVGTPRGIEQYRIQMARQRQAQERALEEQRRREAIERN
jgi:hypothetical protein